MRLGFRVNRKKVAYAAVKHRNLEMLKLVFDVSLLSFPESRKIFALVVEKGVLPSRERLFDEGSRVITQDSSMGCGTSMKSTNCSKWST